MITQNIWEITFWLLCVWFYFSKKVPLRSTLCKLQIGSECLFWCCEFVMFVVMFLGVKRLTQEELTNSTKRMSNPAQELNLWPSVSDTNSDHCTTDASYDFQIFPKGLQIKHSQNQNCIFPFQYFFGDGKAFQERPSWEPALNLSQHQNCFWCFNNNKQTELATRRFQEADVSITLNQYQISLTVSRLHALCTNVETIMLRCLR